MVPFFLWLSLCLTFFEVNAKISGLANIGSTFMEEAPLKARADVVKLHKAASNDRHTVVFEIVPNNKEKLHDILMDVSDPKSSRYGKHWSFEELTQYTYNHAAHKFMKKFLQDNGVSIVKTTKNGDYIVAEAAVSFWEELLNTEFHHYCVVDETDSSAACVGKSVVRAPHYSLPHELTQHISAVLNTVDIPAKSTVETRFEAYSSVPLSRTHLRAVDTATVTPPLGYVYPQLFSSVYGISNNTGGDSVTQAIFGSLGEQVSPADLTYFQDFFDLPIVGLAGDVNGHVSNSACTNVSGGCGEANLDVQYITSVAQKVPTTYYYWADNNNQVDWVGWITSVADLTTPADVYSISYGQMELGITASIMNSFNYQAQKLGIQGVTILASSGDRGVTGTTSPYYACKGYYPAFPASSQYITTVGATMGPEANKPEVACETKTGPYPSVAIITSGGGFSNLNKVPSWQQASVQGYFDHVQGTTYAPHSTTKYNYNTTGRGYPDVALLGHAYIVAENLTMSICDGTSASTPAMAGIVSLANYRRVSANQPKLGFLNPFLYTYADQFVNDVTSGGNFCYSTSYSARTDNYTATCCSTSTGPGFYCAPGWDPVTGLGSINAGKFFTTVMDVVTPSPAPTLMPTATPIVIFSATQVISGISLDTYNSNTTLYQAVLVATIAGCMDGIDTNDITQVHVTSVNQQGRRHLQSSSSSSISAAYIVTDSNSGATYNSLNQQLVSAVKTGTFTTLLNSNAKNAGATGFVNATSSYITTEPILYPGDTGSDGNSLYLSTGAIIGIVIGAVAGALLIGGLVYYFVVMKPKRAAATNHNSSTSEIPAGVDVSEVHVENPIGNKQ